jgi:hypothetical protein
MPEWRKVADFPSYSVSDDGQVRNDRFGRLLVPSRNTGHYLYVQFYDHGRHRTKYVHLLVANAFLVKPDGAEQVDHINGDKEDNRVQNLRWVTVSENRLAYGNEERALARMRPVYAVCTDGARLDFPSRKEAADHFHCSDTKIKYGKLYKKGEKKGWTFFQAGGHFR